MRPLPFSLLALVLPLGSSSAALAQDSCFLTPIEFAAADAFDLIGWGVALSGDRMALGAPGYDNGSISSGGVLLMERQGGIWTQTGNLFGFDNADRMGAEVELEGSTLVVGSPVGEFIANREGRVDVYQWASGSPSHVATLSPSAPSTLGDFGAVIGLDGDTMVVGAPAENVAGVAAAGAAYIFERVAGTWTLKARLTAQQPRQDGGFGRAVAVSGDRVLVGARLATFGDPYTRMYREGPGGGWTADLGFLPDTPSSGSLGYGVALSLPWAFVVSNDQIHVLRLDQDVWTQTQTLGGGYFGTYNFNFGAKLAVDGEHLVVGDLAGDSAIGGPTGNATVYKRSGNMWNHHTTLAPEQGQSNEWMGIDVALDGDVVVAGAPHARAPLTSTGRAWITRLADQIGQFESCPTNAHSAGFPARLVLSGSLDANNPCLRMDAIRLPFGNTPGYFLASQTVGFVPNPGGSQGNLCLGGQIVRIRTAAGGGWIGQETYYTEVDPTTFPAIAGGPVHAGQSWTFQAWFRDFHQSANTSNFSTALTVTFE